MSGIRQSLRKQGLEPIGGFPGHGFSCRRTGPIPAGSSTTEQPRVFLPSDDDRGSWGSVTPREGQPERCDREPFLHLLRAAVLLPP